MRLIMARLIWNFDIELADQEDKTWLDQCVFLNLWLKPPLNVRLTPVTRKS